MPRKRKPPENNTGKVDSVLKHLNEYGHKATREEVMKIVDEQPGLTVPKLIQRVIQNNGPKNKK
ncbi:MAG: hypothetical protein CL944_01245 [Candidatus Diapherotrites archaeon]|uniref:Uncharacterized protein n=1 Tax=Candidatus Iainarchaeum sp. TaxID=3101447 RepID=A0A2D6LPG9_9ARCH|nr:hypothetical protein [Candidatus Diapherotrites archaeon]|tara:strand:- start:4402 stop:4593 length:192 start_codon:yes stop_codon:yes gene_type:complete